MLYYNINIGINKGVNGDSRRAFSCESESETVKVRRQAARTEYPSSAADGNGDAQYPRTQRPTLRGSIWWYVSGGFGSLFSGRTGDRVFLCPKPPPIPVVFAITCVQRYKKCCKTAPGHCLTVFRKNTPAKQNINHWRQEHPCIRKYRQT